MPPRCVGPGGGLWITGQLEVVAAAGVVLALAPSLDLLPASPADLVLLSLDPLLESLEVVEVVALLLVPEPFDVDLPASRLSLR